MIDVLLAARQEGQEHDVSVHAPVSTLPQTQPATTVHHQLDGGQKVITHDALNDLVEDSEGKHFFFKTVNFKKIKLQTRTALNFKQSEQKNHSYIRKT